MIAAHWESLGAYFSSPGVFTEVIHLYLATDLTPAAVGTGSTAKCSRSNGGRSKRPSRRARSGELTDAQDHHRNSASRGTTKNCVKRLHRPGFEVAEMVAMSNTQNRRVGHTCAVSDNNSNSKPPQAANRRRVSQIVHDDRGNARVEWIDAGYAGVPLERAPLSHRVDPASRRQRQADGRAHTRRADSIRTRASAQRTFPSRRSRRSSATCASSASGSS